MHGGQLRTVPDRTIAADRVLALPRLQGHPIHGVPQTVEGFVPVDEHGRVVGVEDVFAAGDITTFPVKHGGIASQQAVAAAETIAASAGVELAPRPFEPVLRGLLLTGSTPRYLRRDMSGGDEESEWVSESPIWWPPTKIAGRRLAPFLASLAGEDVRSDEPPPGQGVTVEVDLGDRDLRRLTAARFEPHAAEPRRAEPEPLDTKAPTTIFDVMDRDPLGIEPDDTLADVAARMCKLAVDSALVVADGRLVGILTARDFVRAAANRLQAGEARVQEWMTAEPVTATPGTTLTAAGLLMTEYGIHHLPVVHRDRLVGMVGSTHMTRPMLLTDTVGREAGLA
jgi:CBS domain-containing protein